VWSTNFYLAQVLPPYDASFAAFWQEFCGLMAGVLPPYGGSFATLSLVLVYFSMQYKSLLHFLGVEGCVCVKVIPYAVKNIQKCQIM